MPSDYPTKRPIGVAPGDRTRGERYDPAVANIPWIDSHQHTHTLSWSDRETFELTGAEALIAIASSYYWSPYRPVQPDDVRFLWDDALRRATQIADSHFFDQYLAIAVHTWSRVEEWETLLDVLPAYCELDEVVAIGETGIESIQHTEQWPLEEQREVVAAQMDVARETGLPVIVHTPGGSDKGSLPLWHEGRYEEADANFADPVLDPDDPKLEATEIDVELADEVGLPDQQVVVDHADPSIVPFVMENTDCYLNFTLTWFRTVDVGDVAETIRTYGPDRVMIDTDLLGPMKGDPFTMKRAIFDLVRAGIDPDDVRQVVYENPKDVFGI
jgi:hypothetical protein